MALEALYQQAHDTLGQGCVDVSADADHDDLHDTAENELNLHCFLGALNRAHDGLFELLKDHLQHLLKRWV